MNLKNIDLKALADRIAAYEFDDLQSDARLVDRLARENGWSQAYAARVLVEYRHFTMLAVAAGHAVAPSDAVDQAWHLHLTYTRAYWQHFCPEVLGRPLHHEPSRGGAAEQDKLYCWYEQTLASYRRLVGHEPPRDIWPSAVERFAPHHYQRVERSTHWIFKKSMFARAAEVAAAIAVVLVAASWSPILGKWNPLDWKGPDFLSLYLPLLVLAIVMAYVVRRRFRLPDDFSPEGARKIDPYDLARLAHNKRVAIAAAITSLLHGGVLELVTEKRPRLIGTTKTHRLQLRGELTPSAPALEQAVVGLVKSEPQMKVAELVDRLAKGTDGRLEALKAQGLLVPDEHRFLVRTLPALIVLFVAAIGAVKVGVGFVRGRPVEILIVLAVFGFICSLLFFKAPLRSRRGDRVVKYWRDRHAHLRKVSHNLRLTPTDVALAVGLFGVGALATGPFSDLAAVLGPSIQSTGSSIGGGCGGGCGGGGCGGGGCGGCGGGD